LSSTTERQRGQVLAIFALSLVVLLGAGALAFDGGMMILERRDQQNAADAAAMAGARYVTTDHAKARTVAASVAADNGFTNGNGMQVVKVNVPPENGKFATWPNAIQVEIANTRPSILGSVMGFLNWPVGANATAASLDNVGGPFSILALEKTACEAMKIAGTGGITAYGNIQVNSTCPDSALKRQAGGTVDTIALTAESARCNVVGGIQNEGGDPNYLNCDPVEGAPVVPDPLETLPDVEPAPSLPRAAEQLIGNKKIPDGCPGGASFATFDSPAVCQFTSNYKDTTWKLYPGSYPGGLKIQAGNFYFEPGIYWIGGGGLEIDGNGSFIKSVELNSTIEGGGVLFYNTAIPGVPLGNIILNGASANIHLWPLDELEGTWASTWNGLIVYQDRDYSYDGDDLTINGNTSLGMDVRGTIYLPSGDVKVNGNEGDLVMDQIISQTYVVNGNNGDILALKDKDHIFKFTAAGLVE
jgi:Flp pilus assembly protein TadG